MSSRTVDINGSTKTLPPITGRKFVRLGKIIKGITKQAPEILEEAAKFRTQYEAENRVVMDRTQALMRFGPQPLFVEGKTDDGEETMVPALDDDGKVLMAPGRLDHLSDEDWQASDNKLSLPTSPSNVETIAAVFPTAFDAAEDQIVRLIGLMLVDNRELNDAAKEGGGDAVDALLVKEGEAILDDAQFEEILELLVVAFEAAQAQYGKATEKLGDRLGKLGAMFGLNIPTPTEVAKSEPSSTSSPTSSTDSDPVTDGQPTTPSTESSSPSSQPAQVA